MIFDLGKNKIAGALLVSLLVGVLIFFYSLGDSDTKVFLGNGSSHEQKYQEKEERIVDSEKVATLLFGGDMMFDRYIRTVVDLKGFDYIVEDIDETLGGVDFVVANLEGPITDKESVSQSSEFESRENYVFTFPKSVAGNLSRHNIGVVNIGNNHILNFGQDGLWQTKKVLQKEGVRYFGDYSEEKYAGYIKEYNGIKVGLVAYNQFVSKGVEKTLAEINRIKKDSDVVVVYAHWGEEYKVHSNESQRKNAHSFIDSGADLIVGSHPHVVQETEIYKNKKIYYSLGNFIFDQYFEETTKEGLLVKATIDSENSIEFEDIKIKMETNGKTSLIEQ